MSRSQHHLRLSTLLLVGVTCIAMVVLVFVEHGYQRMRQDFFDNESARLLTVNKVISTGGGVEGLTSEAVRRISEASGLESTVPGIVGRQYSLGVGIPAGDTSVMLVGIDDALAGLFGLRAAPEPLTAYSRSIPAGALVLDIPHVVVEDGGYSAGSQTQLGLTVSDAIEPRALDFMLGGNTEGVVVVSAETFQRVASAMFQQEWSTIEDQWNRGDYPMTPLVAAVHLVPKSLDDVETTAERLRQAGFPVSYALGAFEEAADGLRNQVLFSGVLGALLVLGALGYLLAAWRMYLRLSRRDLGVLKHWGMPTHVLSATYGRLLSRACLVAFVAAAIVVAPLGIGVLGWRWGAGSIAVNLGALGVLLLVAYFIGRRLLALALNESVPALLKLHREFQ